MNDNKWKAGIYWWTNKKSGEAHVRSRIDLSKRFKHYLNPPYLTINANVSHNVIYRAPLNHGYASFTLYILGNCNEDVVIQRVQHYSDLLKPEYNHMKLAGPVRGIIHT